MHAVDSIATLNYIMVILTFLLSPVDNKTDILQRYHGVIPHTILIVFHTEISLKKKISTLNIYLYSSAEEFSCKYKNKTE